jgi:hypothetical protein
MLYAQIGSHLALIFYFLMVRNQIATLIPNLVFGHILLAHNLKLKMWAHFEYLYLKTFAKIYWEPNLDQIC